MLTWAIEHPWMTFWLVFFSLFVIDSMFTNICRLANNYLRVKYCKEIGEEEKQTLDNQKTN